MKKIIFLFFVILSLLPAISSASVTSSVTDIICRYAEKVLVRSGSKGAVKAGSETTVRYVLREVTDREAQELSIKLGTKFQHITLSPTVIKETYKFCVDNGIKSTSQFEQILIQIDRTVEVALLEEYRGLRNKKVLSKFEMERLEYLAKCFPKDGRIMSSEGVEDIIKNISKYKYTYDPIIKPAGFTHIVSRHTIKNTQRGTFFCSSGEELISGIKKVLSDSNIRVPKKGNLQVVQKFDKPIGIDENGNPINNWLVIINPKGEVVTSYPVNDRYYNNLLRIQNSTPSKTEYWE